MDKNERMRLMGEGNVTVALLRLGMPMVVGMLVTALYNLVDTYFVSGLGTVSVAAVSMSLLVRAASAYGDEAVAAVGIVLRIVTLGMFVVFGFIKGFQPMAGFNYGAGNLARLDETVKTCLLLTTLFCLAWTAAILCLSGPILSLFSRDARVLAVAGRALIANTVLFFSLGFQFTYSTLYLACGKALEGGFLSAGRQGIFMIPLLLVLPHLFGLDGVLYAQAGADLLTTLATLALIRRGLPSAKPSAPGGSSSS